MLKWWKPLKIRKEKVDDFWYDEKTTKYDMYKIRDNELSPLIIGCNNNVYYLVTTRFAECENRFNGEYELLKPNENEVLIKMTKNGFMGYFCYYVNCERIFMINCDDLNAIIEIDKRWDDDYERIWENSIYNVVDKIKENIFKKEPMFSIIKINLDWEKKTYYENYYLNNDMLNKIIKRIGENKVIENKYDAMDLNYHSLPNIKEYTKKTKEYHDGVGLSYCYKEAINFCEYFLDKYCSWETDKFLEKHKIIKNNKGD